MAGGRCAFVAALRCEDQAPARVDEPVGKAAGHEVPESETAVGRRGDATQEFMICDFRFSN